MSANIEKEAQIKLKSHSAKQAAQAPANPSTETVTPKEEILIDFLKSHIKKNILDPETRDFFLSICDVIEKEIPLDNAEKKDIIMDSYIKFYSLMIVCCSTENVKLNPNNDVIKDLIASIIKFRNPALREKLIFNMISSFSEDSNQFNKIDKDLKKQHLIHLFLARQISSDEKNLDAFKEMISSNVFKQKVKLGKLISLLYSLKESKIDKAGKEQLFSQLIQCHQKDETLTLENAELMANYQEELALTKQKLPMSKNARKKKEKLKANKERQLKSKLEQIKAKEKLLQETSESSSEAESLRQSITALEQNYEKLKNKIDKVTEELKRDDELQSKNHEVIQLDTPRAPDLHEIHHLDDGMRMLSIITLLDSKEMVDSIIREISEGKKFSLLSDQKILQSIFRTVFDIDESYQGSFDKLWQLRAPWALVKFHLRLKETKNPKEREKYLSVNREVLMSLLNGTYQDLRMCETDNPHLAKIFKARPKLKQKWSNPPKFKAKDLYSKASARFENYTIQMTSDPTDQLLIGNDLLTCINLDGRLERVQGLLGFIRDGKTQTIVAKDEDDDTNYAETQLQLLWDEENCKPVLFFETVNQIGTRLSPKDYSLNQALIRYAKRYAKDLGVDLVASRKCWLNMPSYTKKDNLYDGKVVSLGSSSPIEYVNASYRNESRTFSVGETYKMLMVNEIKVLSNTNQRTCSGPTDIEKSREVFDKIVSQAPEGIHFNPKKLKGRIRDGNCSALALDFAKKYFELLSKRESLPAPTKLCKTDEETFLNFLDEVSELMDTYKRSGGDNVAFYRSVQEAFNSIEVDKTKVDVDLTANKIQALANYFDLSITPKSDECDFVEDAQEGLIESVDKLEKGVYVLRNLCPGDTELLEQYGHTMIYIKLAEGAILFDPSNDSEFWNMNWPADRLYTGLKKAYDKWKIKRCRFYKITPKPQQDILVA